MNAVVAGAGALEALAAPGEGRVLASFPKACYLDLPSGLVALVGPDAHRGPLHLVLDAPPPRPPGGAGVRVSARTIDLDGIRIGLDGAEPWIGYLPDPVVVSAAVPWLVEALAPEAHRSLVPQDRAAAALSCLSAGDLHRAARRLAGAGPGLTPAGDDALAGILFALRSTSGRAAETLLTSIARAAETTTLSGAFLLWAARGQALAPVHALIEAAVAGDLGGARTAASMLGAVGHSSGADFAWGLMLGFSTLPRMQPASARH